MKLSGIFRGKVMVEKGLQSYELKQVFHGKTSVMCIVNCPFLFLVGDFQKLASRNRNCIESVQRTYKQAGRCARSLTHIVTT